MPEDNTPIRELRRRLEDLEAEAAMWTNTINELKDKRALAQIEGAEIVEAIATLRAAQVEG